MECARRHREVVGAILDRQRLKVANTDLDHGIRRELVTGDRCEMR